MGKWRGKTELRGGIQETALAGAAVFKERLLSGWGCARNEIWGAKIGGERRLQRGWEAAQSFRSGHGRAALRGFGYLVSQMTDRTKRIGGAFVMLPSLTRLAGSGAKKQKRKNGQNDREATS